MRWLFVYLSFMTKCPLARVIRDLATTLALATVLSCSSAPKTVAQPIDAADPVGGVPTDLWLEIDVSPGRSVEDRAKIEERRVRVVLLPDGSLHGESDRVPHNGLRPARVRRLAREQMVDVWTALRAAGFTDPALAVSLLNFSVL